MSRFVGSSPATTTTNTTNSSSCFSTTISTSFSSRVFIPPPATEFATNQATTSDYVAKWTRGQPLERLPSLTLAKPEQMRDRNVERFLVAFRNCCTLRKKTPSPGFDVNMLPCSKQFDEEFRHLMCKKNTSIVLSLRIGYLSVYTVQRAAASAVYFLSFLKLQKETHTDLESHFNDSLVTISERLKALTVAEKTEIITRFIIWYESIPPVRITSHKVIAAANQTSRVICKENSTMATVAKGLLAFLTFAGVIVPSHCKNSTEECKQIWAGVKAAFACCNKAKGGTLDFSQAALSLDDLTRLMRQSNGVTNMAGMQGWLLAILLAGTGLRIGSVRNATAPGPISKANNEKRTQPTFDDDDDHDSSDDEGDRFGDDLHSDDETRDDGAYFGNNNDGNDDPLTMRDADGGDDSVMQVDFDCLRANDIKVYRVPRENNDPSGFIRFRSELSIVSNKTTGQKFFTPEIIGFDYPRINEDSSYDWSMNGGVALVFLSVAVGATDPEKLLDPKFEPERGTEMLISNRTTVNNCNNSRNEPLFRCQIDSHGRLGNLPMRHVVSPLKMVADSVSIPSSLFTSRSYRYLRLEK
ncbi:hypothetical protein CAEBREN_15190 [Caenorhabditis brenneri]|uniref:Uncharacterized protein n=1 Tax=Caenorhabditis brenneri TaxID=135651 RepID=G0MSF7_CAEBE|nr:hypothetical protein CAEBREN_15190 [Caenorhabditis brenneri]